jgi:hypothetical protein
MRASGSPLQEDRRYPPPWSVKERADCLVVRDANGQALGYFSFDEEPHWRAVSKRGGWRSISRSRLML